MRLFQRVPTGGRHAATRLGVGALVLTLALLVPVVGVGSQAALAAGSTVVLSVHGQSVVFSTSGRTGQINLSSGGYAYENPGFDFASGQETSGPNATGDITLPTTGATPYAIVGDLAVLLPGATSVSPQAGAEAPALVNEVLVVVDSEGADVLVQITAVSANTLTFVYSIGRPEHPAAALGNSAWVMGHPLIFPGPAKAGEISLSGDGEVSVSPGFDFELGHQVDTGQAAAGLGADLVQGRLVLHGNLARLNASAQAATWPAPAVSAPVAGSQYLLVDGAGNYVLLQITGVSATAVTFQYRLLLARSVPVLSATPVTLRLDGSAVTFSGPLRYGAILAQAGSGALENPGFLLDPGREVSGLDANPDLTLDVVHGQVDLRGLLATFPELSSGGVPSVIDVAAVPFDRLVAVDGLGRYVLVGIESATPGAVTFAYEIESAGATAVLQPPNPASVRTPAVPAGAGTIVYAAFTGAAARLNGTIDPTTGRPTDPAILEQASVEGVDVGTGARFALSTGLSALAEPLLSPNGVWLATVVGSDISVERRGGPPRLIAQNGDTLGGSLPAMSWSPDSQYLAYVGMASGNGYEGGGALWVIQPSTGKSQMIVNSVRVGVVVEWVGWLPGDRLVFSTRGGLYEVSANWASASPLPVRMGAMGEGGRFALSPDGTLVTWVARGGNGHEQVLVATLNGKQRVMFTDSAWDNWSPVFSPDGSTVIYVADTGLGPGGELWYFTIDGKEHGATGIAHVLDIEQWAYGTSADGWKG